MNSKVFPGILILVAGFSSAAMAWLSAGNDSDPVVHLFTTFLAAGLLTLLARVQQWKMVAWAPVAGFAVASAGVALDVESLTYTGYFAFAVLSIWHGHQLERRAESSAA